MIQEFRHGLSESSVSECLTRLHSRLLASMGLSSEAGLRKAPLPSSHDCCQDSVLWAAGKSPLDGCLFAGSHISCLLRGPLHMLHQSQQGRVSEASWPERLKL